MGRMDNYNKYEKIFATRCIQQGQQIQHSLLAKAIDVNRSPGGLCPCVVHVMLEDISEILPTPVDDIPDMIRFAHNMVKIAADHPEIMLGCDPEYYGFYYFFFPRPAMFDRMSAITAIWLVMFTRCTKKTPHKDMYAYLRRLHKLQWCLIRMFFYNYDDLKPDPTSVRVWNMLIEKYGKNWHNVQMHQKDRVQVFLDILHMYSFEYYPPYSKGEFGHRGEYQGADNTLDQT